MKDEQILKQAIEKAGKNGYDFQELKKEPEKSWNELTDFQKNLGVKYYLELHLYPTIIFSHDFAKAFWGEGEISTGEFGEYRKCKNDCKITSIIHNYQDIIFCPDCGEKIITEKTESFETDPWIGHLQQMVLEKEPFKYIEKFL